MGFTGTLEGMDPNRKIKDLGQLVGFPPGRELTFVREYRESDIGSVGWFFNKKEWSGYAWVLSDGEDFHHFGAPWQTLTWASFVTDFEQALSCAWDDALNPARRHHKLEELVGMSIEDLLAEARKPWNPYSDPPRDRYGDLFISALHNHLRWVSGKLSLEKLVWPSQDLKDYVAEVPNAVALKNASDVLRNLEDPQRFSEFTKSPTPTGIICAGDGGVGIFWMFSSEDPERSRIYVDVTCDNTGAIWVTDRPRHLIAEISAPEDQPDDRCEDAVVLVMQTLPRYAGGTAW